jgi:hypothetical protein
MRTLTLFAILIVCLEDAFSQNYISTTSTSPGNIIITHPGTFTSSNLSTVSSNSPGLTVSGNTSSTTTADVYITRANSSANAGNAPAIQLSDLGSGSNNLIQSSPSGLQFFNFYAGSGWIERIRLTSDGKVGIGTTNPQKKLDIQTNGNGGLSVSGNSSGYQGSDIAIVRTGTSTEVGKGSAFQFDDNQFNTHAIIQNSIGGLQFFNLNDYSNGWAERMRIALDGKVGIGTTNPDALLAVAGQVHATEVRVTTNVPGPDYVFEKDYKLSSLEEIKNYIDQNKHLPEVPSAKEMEKNGVQLGEMNMLLLKKIEELTLYVIELKNENSSAQAQMKIMQTEINQLKK